MKYTVFCLIVFLLLCTVSTSEAVIIPGDANQDNLANIGDAVFIINYVFRHGPEPVNQSAADVNNDCGVNIGDAVVMINYVFKPGTVILVLGCQHLDISGNCIEGSEQKNDSGYMILEVLGNDLHIHHMNANYQCCLGYYVDYAIEGMNIIARESDTAEECDCICRFDLESTFYDLADGDYLVTLIGINGDTVGVGGITVNADFGLVDYQHSGCLDKGASSSVGIEYLYSGDTLTLHHDDAYFNCGARLMVSFEQAGDTLRFYEVNISDLYALCMCYFEVTVSVIGISPGTFVAEIYAQDMPGTIILSDRRVIELEP